MAGITPELDRCHDKDNRECTTPSARVRGTVRATPAPPPAHTFPTSHDEQHKIGTIYKTNEAISYLNATYGVGVPAIIAQTMPAVRAALAKAEAPVLETCAPLVQSIVAMQEQMRQANPLPAEEVGRGVGDVSAIPFELLLKVGGYPGSRV